MANPQDGGQAFPQSVTFDRHDIAMAAYPGMTLRDWFASQALMGMLANVNADRGRQERGRDLAAVYAEAAYIHADAMIAERSK